MDETRRMLELLNAGFPDITGLDPLAARALVDARVRAPDNLDDVAAAHDETIAQDVPVRVYEPHTRRPGAPATVFVHGGGFLHGSIASHDGFCRRWAKHTASVVVSVEHRRAPEHRAPAGAEDVAAAIEWTADAGLGDGVVVAGDSSGGNLAAVAALMFRDRGDSPLRGLVVAYPFLDPAMDTASHRTRAQGYFVTSGQLRYYWETYLGGPVESAEVDWRISPLQADLAGLPPAIVVTAGLDPLCDEGRAFAARLREAGVPVLHRHHPDQFHGFLTIPGYGPGRAAAELLWTDVIDTLTAPAPQEAA
jgi:acetyl esterase